ncbi:MAG: DUF4328 domain-containing protein [Propionibacteriaceae bacterium]|nr:DUF4328 domain-containing protein [Propionibacteriaceae bacterium]
MSFDHPASPPANWYPDPTQAGILRYWDGGGWTAHTHPAAGVATTSGHGLPAGFGTLATAVRVLVGLCGLTAVFDLVVQAWGAVVISAAAADPAHLDISVLELYDNLNLGSAWPALALAFAAGVVWLVWQHRLAGTVPRAALRRSPGWHVGSWLIPIACLIFPYQNMVDLHRALTPAQGAPLRRTPARFGVWWVAWLGSGLIAALAVRISSIPDVTLEILAQASMVAAVGDILEIIAAVLAIGIVGDLSRAALQPASLPTVHAAAAGQVV